MNFSIMFGLGTMSLAALAFQYNMYALAGILVFSSNLILGVILTNYAISVIKQGKTKCSNQN